MRIYFRFRYIKCHNIKIKLLFLICFFKNLYITLNIKIIVFLITSIQFYCVPNWNPFFPSAPVCVQSGSLQFAMHVLKC